MVERICPEKIISMSNIAWLFVATTGLCVALRSDGNCTIASEGQNGTIGCPNIQGEKVHIQASDRDSACRSIFQKTSYRSYLSSVITNDSRLIESRHHPLLCDVSVCKSNSLWNCSGNEDFGRFCFCYQQRFDLLHQTESHVFDLLSLLALIGVLLVLIVLTIIIFFNCNLVTGPVRSCIFMYQCSALARPIAGIDSFIVLENQLYTSIHSSIFLALPIGFNGPNHPVLSHYYFIEYFKYFILFVLVSIVLLLIRYSECPLRKCRLPWAKTRRAVRKFREKHTAKRTILHGISSCLVLAYGDLVAITFIILSEGVPKCCFSQEDMCPQQCPVSNTFVTRAIPGIFGFACFVLVLLLLPPLLLIYYPLIPSLVYKLTKKSLPRFSKLHPVFDVFQGVYKDKFRWYAGLHLYYIVFLWGLNAGITLAVEPKWRSTILSFGFIVILGIHSLLQPYKQQRHNYYESLYLLYLVLGSLTTQVYFFFVLDNINKIQIQLGSIIAFLISMLLEFCPVVTAIVICCTSCKRNCSCCRTSRCCPCVSPTRDEENDANYNSEGSQREQFLYYDPAA